MIRSGTWAGPAVTAPIAPTSRRTDGAVTLVVWPVPASIRTLPPPIEETRIDRPLPTWKIHASTPWPTAGAAEVTRNPVSRYPSSRCPKRIPRIIGCPWPTTMPCGNARASA
jgi:hypothetical protein